LAWHAIAIRGTNRSQENRPSDLATDHSPRTLARGHRTRQGANTERSDLSAIRPPQPSGIFFGLQLGQPIRYVQAWPPHALPFRCLTNRQVPSGQAHDWVLFVRLHQGMSSPSRKMFRQRFRERADEKRSHPQAPQGALAGRRLEAARWLAEAGTAMSWIATAWGNSTSSV